MAALNGHVFYQAFNGVQETLVDFLMELASEITQSNLEAKNASGQTSLGSNLPH